MSAALGCSAETRCQRACSPALKPAMFFAAIRTNPITDVFFTAKATLAGILLLVPFPKFPHRDLAPGASLNHWFFLCAKDVLMERAG